MSEKKEIVIKTPLSIVSTSFTVSSKAETKHEISFGALLKERRKQARLSQKDFADMMNVTRNTIINWEADKSRPDYNLLPEVCSLLNIKLHELFQMPPENGLSPLEDRIVENVRKLSPSSRKVIDKSTARYQHEFRFFKR